MCFQLTTKRAGRSQQLQHRRQPVPCADRESPVADSSTCPRHLSTGLCREGDAPPGGAASLQTENESISSSKVPSKTGSEFRIDGGDGEGSTAPDDEAVVVLPDTSATVSGSDMYSGVCPRSDRQAPLELDPIPRLIGLASVTNLFYTVIRLHEKFHPKPMCGKFVCHWSSFTLLTLVYLYAFVCQSFYTPLSQNSACGSLPATLRQMTSYSVYGQFTRHLKAHLTVT